MKTFLNKIKLYAVAHKILTGFIVLVILGGGYWEYKRATNTSGETRYVTAEVRKGNIVASVSGTGQVSGINQVDLKSKASGDVIYVGVKNGDKVTTGKKILQIDTTDAQRAVRDAIASLASTKLSLQKSKIQNSDQNVASSLNKAYADGWSAVADAFLDLPGVMDGLESLLGDRNLSDNPAALIDKTAQAQRTIAKKSYYAAKKIFDKNKDNYTLLSVNSPREDIENIIGETIESSKSITQAVKDMLNFVNLTADQSGDSTQFASEQSDLSDYTDTLATHLNALANAKTNINDSKDASQNAGLDLESAELAVKDRENSLRDAEDKLADYSVRAPYDGMVANLDLKKLDSVSSGTIVVTIVTENQMAEISLNEVDVAKIKLGDKTTLTFDAIPGLTISGSVAEIDSIGAVSQGVVTYGVKITFDTQDERIKPSMSVSASIITNIKQDVLVVPNSAVKSQKGQSYIEMFSTPLPTPTNSGIGLVSTIAPGKILVKIGLSNDSETEVISGLNEGDEIVIRTIAGTTTSATTAPSLFSGGGTRGITGSGTNRALRGN